MRCITHHSACDCREQRIAVLIKAALDAAVLLDEHKHLLTEPGMTDYAHDLVRRIYLACEALGELQETSL